MSEVRGVIDPPLPETSVLVCYLVLFLATAHRRTVVTRIQSWLCSITISGDKRLHDHLSAWVQFQKYQEDPLDIPKPCPPLGI